MALLRNNNVTAEQVLDSFINAIMTNNTIQPSDNSSSSTQPRWFGVSIQINRTVLPRIAAIATTPVIVVVGDGDDVVLISTLVPTVLVLLICFVVFVVVLQRRTQLHYYYEYA